MEFFTRADDPDCAYDSAWTGGPYDKGINLLFERHSIESRRKTLDMIQNCFFKNADAFRSSLVLNIFSHEYNSIGWAIDDVFYWNEAALKEQNATEKFFERYRYVFMTVPNTTKMLLFIAVIIQRIRKNVCLRSQVMEF
jgi:hypothetical protein